MCNIKGFWGGTAHEYTLNKRIPHFNFFSSQSKILFLLLLLLDHLQVAGPLPMLIVFYIRIIALLSSMDGYVAPTTS